MARDNMMTFTTNDDEELVLKAAAVIQERSLADYLRRTSLRDARTIVATFAKENPGTVLPTLGVYPEALLEAAEAIVRVPASRPLSVNGTTFPQMSTKTATEESPEEDFDGGRVVGE